MKLAWINPVLVIAVAVGGWALCAAFGVDGQSRWIITAAGICAVASVAGGMIIALSRRGDLASVVRGALSGTLVHMGLSLAGGAVVIMAVKPGLSFAGWLGLFFWLTLTILVVTSVRAVRSASPAGAGK